MQPVKAQKGVSTKSLLLDSLKVYLNSKNRLQPIIGLGSIIECVKAGTRSREALYLCEVCVCRLSKADVRNHIMGSLHRYNYIKAWHPHLVSEWEVNADLSKLARPLMEKATILEGKEGPGDVQLVEIEDAVYQRIATSSENDAITLMNILRDGQGELESHSVTTSVQLEPAPIQSHRIVLFAQSQGRQSKKSLKTSAETNPPLSLIRSTVAPAWSLRDNTQTSPETSVLSKNSNSCLDGYTGTKPLIGLFRVVECRGEDGCTYCFLCHCCRIRSNKKDFIDHLTSSSHLMNYLMETHPEQVELMMSNVNNNDQLLQSLAEKVEQEEGRGELQVINAPETLCILLTGKSYHWCIKMLCNGWTHTNIQKRKIAVKGPRVNNTSRQGMPEKCSIEMRKTRKVNNTVFKVSLPLKKGSVLLERTSFSMDRLPVPPTYSPPPDSDVIPSPESQLEDCEFDCDTGSFAVNQAEHTSMGTPSQLQQDLYSGDADAGQYMGPERNLISHQEVDDYFSVNEHISQSKDKNDNTQHNSQEGSSRRFCTEWQNEGPQTQNEWLSSAVSHRPDWSSCNSSYGRVEGYTEQWYSSTSQDEVATSVEVSREERQKETSSDATQYYQQQPQDQWMAQNHASLLRGLSGELDAALINMLPHLGYSRAPSANVASEPGEQFLRTGLRPLLTYMGVAIDNVQTALQSYMMQPMDQQAIQVGPGVTSHPIYDDGPTTNPDRHFPYPSVLQTPR